MSADIKFDDTPVSPFDEIKHRMPLSKFYLNFKYPTMKAPQFNLKIKNALDTSESAVYTDKSDHIHIIIKVKAKKTLKQIEEILSSVFEYDHKRIDIKSLSKWKDAVDYLTQISIPIAQDVVKTKLKTMTEENVTSYVWNQVVFDLMEEEGKRVLEEYNSHKRTVTEFVADPLTGKVKMQSREGTGRFKQMEERQIYNQHNQQCELMRAWDKQKFTSLADVIGRWPKEADETKDDE